MLNTRSIARIEPEICPPPALIFSFCGKVKKAKRTVYGGPFPKGVRPPGLVVKLARLEVVQC